MTRRRRMLIRVAALSLAVAAGVFAPDAAAGIYGIYSGPPRPILLPESLTYVRPVPVTEEASVRIEIEDAVGSGVSIGSGSVLTAAHVVGDAKSVKVKARNGAEMTGAVLWANKDYDVALLHVDADLPAASLSCRQLAVGETISTVGNPLGIEFISSFGRVAGSVREMAPKWKAAIVTDITLIMGNSGGPVFDENGKVSGLVVGVLGAPTSNGGTSYLGFSTAVPSSAICQLMGRGA